MFGASEFTVSVLDDKTEKIRFAMLQVMGEFGQKHYPKIVLRVLHAQGAHSLWYALGDVRAVATAMLGDVLARERISEITVLFRGLLPRSKKSHG
ncbi:MAG: hypothetical protein ACKVIH_07490 [Burkholderiales bacterium]